MRPSRRARSSTCDTAAGRVEVDPLAATSARDGEFGLDQGTSARSPGALEFRVAPGTAIDLATEACQPRVLRILEVAGLSGSELLEVEPEREAKAE